MNRLLISTFDLNRKTEQRIFVKKFVKTRDDLDLNPLTSQTTDFPLARSKSNPQTFCLKAKQTVRAICFSLCVKMTGYLISLPLEIKKFVITVLISFVKLGLLVLSFEVD